MNEEELKKKVDKAKKKVLENELALQRGESVPLKDSFKLQELELKLKTLRERNIEVKKIIEETLILRKKKGGNNVGLGKFYVEWKDVELLLQRLGYEDAITARNEQE